MFFNKYKYKKFFQKYQLQLKKEIINEFYKKINTNSVDYYDIFIENFNFEQQFNFGICDFYLLDDIYYLLYDKYNTFNCKFKNIPLEYIEKLDDFYFGDTNLSLYKINCNRKIDEQLFKEAEELLDLDSSESDLIKKVAILLVNETINSLDKNDFLSEIDILIQKINIHAPNLKENDKQSLIEDIKNRYLSIIKWDN